MCGVFGFVGQPQNVPLTVGVALKSLEYRGYDSWGIVWQDQGSLRSVKQVGRVPSAFTFDAVSRIAVGHTRWATHGGVTEANAHPHLDLAGRVAIVHNGIIENATALRHLLSPNLQFQSQTDSEVVAHLLGEEVQRGHTVTEALRRVFPLLEGQNAIVAIDQQEECIAAAMNVSPLVIGIGERGTCIASDPFALAGRATTMIVAPRNAVVELRLDNVRAIGFDGKRIPLPDAHLVPDVSPSELGGFDSFMAKEMAEQPNVFRWQSSHLEDLFPVVDLLKSISMVVLTGCGSAYFAARLGATWIGRATGIPTIAVQASEMADYNPFIGSNTLVIAVTQSGETADVLEAMAVAKEGGATLLALTNVAHSSAARLAEITVPLGAGRERSVLATKSMTAMLGRLASLCELLSATSADQLGDFGSEIEALTADPVFVEFINEVGSYIADRDDVYVIGKGDAFGVAQEAALKIKEASYIHAEAFAAGELKHGAIALIEEGSPCLLFTSDDRFTRDTASAAQEVRSRGGYTMGVGPGLEDVCDVHLPIPGTAVSRVVLQIVVAQALALKLASLRQLDPDYPRNLAKSVTVK